MLKVKVQDSKACFLAQFYLGKPSLCLGLSLLEALQSQELRDGWEQHLGVPGISPLPTRPVFWADIYFTPPMSWVMDGVRR